MTSYFSVTDLFCGAGGSSRGDTLIPQTYQDGTRQELLLTHEEVPQ